MVASRLPRPLFEHIVSNHGDRQLDGAVSPLLVLPEIVRACPGVPMMIDGGIRRGTDVLKSLAFGARFVLLGRPFAYAAAVAGQAGVALAIDLLVKEVLRNMAMLSLNTLDELESARHLIHTNSGRYQSHCAGAAG